jgi:ornithine cyclodeaminase/alanine dehydrogenase
MNTDVLLLKRSEVASLLTLPECIDAMEEAFRMRAEGRTLLPALAHVDADGGEFHIKAGGLRMERTFFALKANGGFFGNRKQFGLPNIIGLILLCDGQNGRPLAVMDSITITVLRTGATTAVAAKHLARRDSATATICGCGNQGRVQLAALRHALPALRRAFAWDVAPGAAQAFAAEMSGQLGIEVVSAPDLARAAGDSDVIVTCTPAKAFFLRREHVRPGTFVAAVGADSPDKQELDPALVAGSTLVVDILDQCAHVGELHHALEAKRMTEADVHGELSDIVSGKIPGRRSADEITVFDATGSAIQDAAAGAVVYRKALAQGLGRMMNFHE